MYPFADRGYYPPPPYPMYGYHPMYYGMPTPIRDPGYFPFSTHNPYEGMPSICNQQINKFNVVNCQIDQSSDRRSQEPYFNNSTNFNSNLHDEPVRNTSATINREETHTAISEIISTKKHPPIPLPHSEQHTIGIPPIRDSQSLIRIVSLETTPPILTDNEQLNKPIEYEIQQEPMEQLDHAAFDHNDDGASLHTSNTSHNAYTTVSSRTSIGSTRSRTSQRFQQVDSLLSIAISSSQLKPPAAQRPTALAATNNSSSKATTTITSVSASKEKPTGARVNDLPVSLIKKRTKNIPPPLTASSITEVHQDAGRIHSNVVKKNLFASETYSDSKKRKTGEAQLDQGSKLLKSKSAKLKSSSQSDEEQLQREIDGDDEEDHSDEIDEEDSFSSIEVSKKPSKTIKVLNSAKSTTQSKSAVAASKARKPSISKVVKEKAEKPSKVSRTSKGIIYSSI